MTKFPDTEMRQIQKELGEIEIRQPQNLLTDKSWRDNDGNTLNIRMKRIEANRYLKTSLKAYIIM